MTKKALVTGGTGFIGGSLVDKLLERGWEVCVIAKKNRASGYLDYRVQKYIIENENEEFSGEFLFKALANFKPDAIYHLAALQPKEHDLNDIEPIIRSNITLGCLLLECANKLGGVPFVNLGSYWQYYNGTESDPVNLYAATKSAYQEIIKYYTNVHSNPISTLVLVDTYGEKDKRGKVLSLIIQSANEQKQVKLSPGEQKIDFIHVDDVVEGMIHCANAMMNKTMKPGTYALQTGIKYTLHDIYSFVSDIAKKNPLVVWGTAYPKRQIMDVLIPWITLPGWKAKVTLHEGIKRLHQSCK